MILRSIGEIDAPFDLLTRWAAKGNPEAQYRLANSMSDEEGLEWYLKAARKGHVLAQYHLGCYYKANPDEAIKWHLKAALQGYSNAQCSLAELYETKGELKEAFKWLSKAADQNYPWALYKMGIHTQELKWFLGAACRGHAEAQYYVGELLHKEKNFTQAIKWYKKAEAQGIEAQCEIGLCYEELKNYEECVIWYAQAVKLGEAAALNNLGHCYYDGLGVDKDLDKAFHLFKAAADQGLAVAQYNLGNWYTVAKNSSAAIEWYLAAADQGYAKAQYELGMGCFKSRNYKEAFKWFEAAQGDPKAEYMLGLLLYYGKGGAINRSKAFKLFKRAAEREIPEGQFFLGRCYLRGEGTQKDLLKGVKLITKAAEKQFAPALRALEFLALTI